MTITRPTSEYVITEDHNAGLQRIVARFRSEFFVCWTSDIGTAKHDGTWHRMREDGCTGGHVADMTARELDSALRAYRETGRRGL